MSGSPWLTKQNYKETRKSTDSKLTEIFYNSNFLSFCINKQYTYLNVRKSTYFKNQSWDMIPRNLLQLNLVIRNFSVTLKLFLNAKCSLSLWSKLTIGHGKWFLNTNLFLIKTFLIAKFDCISIANC